MKPKYICHAILLSLGSAALLPAQPLTGAVQISAGGHASCAVLAGGKAKCWGDGDINRLGEDWGDDAYYPVNVAGWRNGVAAVSAGYDHTCVITTAGGVQCLGNNNNGQLGDGTFINPAHLPVDVKDLSDVVAIAAGEGKHTCAVTAAGAVKCWGSNELGQLGNTSVTDKSRVPVDVEGVTGAVALCAGEKHTCAVTNEGIVKCWGYNEFGQLGNGTTENSPVPVEALSGAASVACGYDHTCAVTTAGGLKCWGINYSGEIGNGEEEHWDVESPVDVVGLASGVAAVAAGYMHTCAVMTSGGVKCWGGNSEGQIGDGTGEWRLTPADVKGLSSGVTAISSGDEHSCALLADGGVKCWGDNSVGQIGTAASWSSTSDPCTVVVGAGDLTGVVTLNGKPLPGVTVNYVALNEVLIRGSSVVTDFNGYYSFPDRRYNRECELRPSRSGYAFIPPVRRLAVAGETVQNFTAVQMPAGCYALTVLVNPTYKGSVTAKPKPNCAGAFYKANTKVRLRAKAESGYKFKRWTGAKSGKKPATSLVMNRSRIIKANFK